MRKEFLKIILLLLAGHSLNVNAGFDIPPQFPGGDMKLMEFFRENLVYPEDAIRQGTEGRVILRFCVTETGKIDSLQVQRSLSPSCDREALRIAASMPDWLPGKFNGKPVQVYYTLPVKFDLKAWQEEHAVDISDLQDSIPASRATAIIDRLTTSPQFPGGEKALMQYIAERMYYPAFDGCVQGRVVLRFVVTPCGDIENIEVLRSLHPDFDKVAIDIVKSMPRWTPAQQEGMPVRCYYTLPFLFRLG
jgi:TonB family protein